MKTRVAVLLVVVALVGAELWGGAAEKAAPQTTREVALGADEIYDAERRAEMRQGVEEAMAQSNLPPEARKESLRDFEQNFLKQFEIPVFNGSLADLLARISNPAKSQDVNLVTAAFRRFARTQSPKEAMEMAESIQASILRSAARQETFRIWLGVSPVEATQWLLDYRPRLANEESFLRSAYGRSVGANWGKSDPVAAIAWLESHSDLPGAADGAQGAVEAWMKKDRNAAIAKTKAMTNVEFRDASLEVVCREIARTDTDLGIKTAESISDRATRRRVIYDIIGAVRAKDPAAAEALMKSTGVRIP